MTKPLILVDGSSYLYRAFHAMYKADLRNSRGEPTGAIKTVINMLRRLQKDYPESVIVVVFDAKGKTFRDDIYPQYKANRPPMPDDLRQQMAPIFQIIDAMGLPRIVVEGVEADDVMGTLAIQAASTGIDVLISTGDKDMAQLVNERITLINTMTDTVMDMVGVEEKFGIPATLVIDFLALMGDKVDNIPGVPGVGEKTALALLQNLGSLDDIYKNLPKVSQLAVRGAKSLAKKLEEHQAQAQLSYQLATIKTDVDVGVRVDELVVKPADEQALSQLYQHYEFHSWLEERLDAPASKVEKDYQMILSQSALADWLETLKRAGCFAFDTETTALDYLDARIVGVSFATEANKAAYVPCGHDYLGAPAQLSLEEVLTALKPLLESEEIKKVGQNLKYDRHVLKNHGIELRGVAFDTMLASYVFHSTATRHDMDSLAQTYLGAKTISFEAVAGKGAKQLTFNQILVEEALPYAAEDADITWQLYQALKPQLEATAALNTLFATLELPLAEVVGRMERTGTRVDGKLLEQQSQELQHRLEALEKQAFDLAQESFNLASPKQLGHILFEKLALPVIKKTPKGAPSTSEEVLQELALDYPLPKVLMEHRHLAKLKSTYTDKLPKMIHPQTGRIHTSYHQAVTATGRLSSSEPNLQNIPIKRPEGRLIRQAFLPRAGCCMLAADYSQIELRIMAHLSQDKHLIDAFGRGEDIHRATAAEVFDVLPAQVSDAQRRSAKAINFGLIYGMSAFGLAKQLGLGRNDAQAYIDRYFERYPGVKQYMDDVREQAAAQGYVETLMGRRLYLPEINSTKAPRRQAAERTAINAPMQGTAADIIKQAMLDVDAWLNDPKTQAEAFMVMQVHDELVFEVGLDDVSLVTEKVVALMSQAVTLSVPLVVDVGVGANWDEAH